MNQKIADLIFPSAKPTDYWTQKYPVRKTNAFRYAPSPTGYLHVGGLGMALACRFLATNNKGILFLRVEDTDQKREIEGATELLVAALDEFGITFDEGFDGKKNKGKYAPYRQSDRTEIYQAFAKKLLIDGNAYPCFCSAEDITKIREEQAGKKQEIGYHGKYARCAGLSVEEIEKLVKDKKEFVIRFNPDKTREVERIEWNDDIRGKMSLPAINNHPVIIKSNGLPPYNFAHVVDDFLMGTSHVLRGEEWLPSTAEHIQIAEATLGAITWSYGHMPVITIMDDGGKRKLSKRKDKCALADNLLQEGYPKQAVIEYLLTLYNGDFEKWRLQNPDAGYTQFNFRFEKIGTNNPLFDIKKLEHISREIISKKTKKQINDAVTEYLAKYNPQSRGVMEKIFGILAIDRESPKPRKDIAKYSEILTEYDYMITRPNISVDRGQQTIALEFLQTFNIKDDRETWFEKIKVVAKKLGYADNMKDYKNNPAAYKGSIGDVTQSIRLMVTGKPNTPDLYEIMKVLGNDEVRTRLK
ncbi:MAG: glutamate--tRNA ligase [Firmicutes bacterium]|nr:glutamate--tRNA ligase [Bacillota bacterium]